MKLHYFSPEEFHGWYDKMSPELLVKLDVLRHQWGRPIRISPAPGAVGRDDNSQSQHNYGAHGEVRAVDVFPAGVITEEDAERFILSATDCGFRGIGVYADWSPSIGFHLDVRPDKDIGYPATWGAVNNELGAQKYVTMAEALEAIV